jgi:3-methyladenine DNA glycosylase AlkC
MTTVPKTRKGARTVATVAPDVLAALEAGTLESANLTEGLAIRMDRLMQNIAPSVPANAINLADGIVVRMAQGGAALRAHSAARAFQKYAAHSSDTVRGWAAFAIGQNEALAPMERLEAMKPFAADLHFGVREWAWMAVRAIIVADPSGAIKKLTPWTKHADLNVRRFASEATRPRGVWAASIPLLRKEPLHALPILTPLRHDPHKYVEDSIANWINDAAKDNPAWVKALLKEWRADKVAPRLLERAARSL